MYITCIPWSLLDLTYLMNPEHGIFKKAAPSNTIEFLSLPEHMVLVHNEKKS